MVRGQLVCIIGSVGHVLNGGEGTVGVYWFCGSGVKWW